MATKKEKAALVILLDELQTARFWFEDTAYPRRSRARFEEAIAGVKKAFQLPRAADCGNQG